MSETNKEIVRRYFEEVLGAGNLDVVSALVDTSYTNHSLTRADTGFVGLRNRLTALRTAFPDLSVELHDLIAEDDKIVARWTLRGTHEGPFNEGWYNNIPPTGRPTAMTAITIFRLAEDKIVECWNERDRLGRLRQLGVLPNSAAESSPAEAPDRHAA